MGHGIAVLLKVRRIAGDGLHLPGWQRFAGFGWFGVKSLGQLGISLRFQAGSIPVLGLACAKSG